MEETSKAFAEVFEMKAEIEKINEELTLKVGERITLKQFENLTYEEQLTLSDCCSNMAVTNVYANVTPQSSCKFVIALLTLDLLVQVLLCE